LSATCRLKNNTDERFVIALDLRKNYK